MAYDLCLFILSKAGRTRNLTIRAWPGDGAVLMGLWGLELLICAGCIDGRDNVVSNSEDEGIHRDLVQNLECVFGNERVEFCAEYCFVITLDTQGGHLPHACFTRRLAPQTRGNWSELVATCEVAVEGGAERSDLGDLFTLAAPRYGSDGRQSKRSVRFVRMRGTALHRQTSNPGDSSLTGQRRTLSLLLARG
jgi:hypothetical protein